MTINQRSKIKDQNLIILISFIFLIGHWSLVIGHFNTYAVSPTITPKLSPSASPSASLAPTSADDEKVQEIRDAIKEKLTQIKEKIEKKAYVGTILEITDSTLTLTNFRGKKRVRILESTTIIGANKKEVPIKDLAVEDKVIAMGEPDNNETLEAKRIVVVPPLKIVPAKRIVFLGIITEINTKTSTLGLTAVKNLDQTIQVKVDKNTAFFDAKDTKAVIVFKNLKETQKLLVVYPEPAEGKAIIAKTIFLLP